MENILSLLVVGAIAIVAYNVQRQQAAAREASTLRELVGDHPAAGVEQQAANNDPLLQVPEDARPLLSGLLEAMRSTEALEGLADAVTPSVFEELRASIDSVRAYAAQSSPETADGMLQTRLYDAGTRDLDSFWARVFLGTPFTAASGRTVSVIRQDLLLEFRLLAAVECEQCGAPLSGVRACTFCGTHAGDARWRAIGVQPPGTGTSPDGGIARSFVGYRMPDLADQVRAVS